MLVVLILAAVAILAGVILAALGRAGEMAAFPGDSPPVDARGLSAAEIALLQPPLSLWGYNAQVTHETLQAIARSVSERDTEIETLRRELAELRERNSLAGPRRDSLPGRDFLASGWAEEPR